MAQQFHYPPLDRAPGAVRLLVLGQDLHPEDGRLRCKLVASTINAKYEALSYMWGKPDEFDLKIWVNDCHFSVRQNLYCALTTLRTTGDRYLWIDTLCINQDDSSEKGHQVDMMDLVYEKAVQILVWLGCPDELYVRTMSIEDSSSSGNMRLVEESVPAFALVRAVVGGRKKNPLSFDEWGYFRPYFRRKWIPHWKQLAELFAAPYWRRLWIVQEFGLATKLQILYGTSICDGFTFLLFRELLYRLPIWAAREDIQALIHATAAAPNIGISMQQILSSPAMFMPGRVKEVVYGNGFESLLSKCEEQLCAERRDKIYAILRLPHDVKDGDIPVDYKISIPQLYERTLAWSCKREGNSKVDRFSGVVLRALLGPLSIEDSPIDMFGPGSSGIDDKSNFHSDLADYEISTLLIGQMWMVPIDIRWIDATLEHIRKPEVLLKEIPEELKNKDPTALISSLERLWEVDPQSIQALGRGQKIEGVKLFILKTGTETRLGLGPACIKDSDILCRLSGRQTVAICRHENDDYHFVGRAAIGYGQRGKTKADVTKHHPLWPPPELDIYSGPVDNPTLVRTWKVGLELLQALTCPLKWRKP